MNACASTLISFCRQIQSSLVLTLDPSRKVKGSGILELDFKAVNAGAVKLREHALPGNSSAGVALPASRVSIKIV
jgi:hypothetical protein